MICNILYSLPTYGNFKTVWSVRHIFFMNSSDKFSIKSNLNFIFLNIDFQTNVVPKVDSGIFELPYLVEISIPVNIQPGCLEMGFNFHLHPFSGIVSSNRDKADIIKSCFF